MKVFDNVFDALDGAWQMLARSPLSFSPAMSPLVVMPCARHYLVSIVTPDGSDRVVVLQISPDRLMALTCAMFFAAEDEVTQAQIDDVGKELCNILSASCIKHLQVLENCEVGLPRAISSEEFEQIVSRGSILSRVAAGGGGNADGGMCLSVILSKQAKHQEQAA